MVSFGLCFVVELSYVRFRIFIQARVAEWPPIGK